MLNKYKQTQPIAYKILKNAVSKEKYSHAYLFETNGFCDTYKLILDFIKEIMCKNIQNPNHNPTKCTICHQIDTNNYPEIKIIKPEGMWIKKDQLKQLQNEFNKKPIIGNKKIYIIQEAQKLNKQSSNSILKFLEEPEEGIIAILITDNIYEILETIRSRCQIIQLKETQIQNNVESTLSQLLYQKSTLEPEEKEKITKTLEFINYYEQNHLDTIIYMQKLWHDHIKTKEEMITAFNLIILYYKEILNSQITGQIKIFKEYEKEINDIQIQNDIKTICKKLTIINQYKDKIKYNINPNLLMDKLIIKLEGR